MIVCLAIVGYFLCLLGLSYAIARTGDNDAFFRAERRSPWYMVAFGMIGASISGVTFVSVPGMVLNTQMTYLQMCLGFIPGYFAVAFVLLPVYYKLRLTTIYTYLRHRLGRKSYLTGSGFFFLSKLTGSAVQFYVVCAILQHFSNRLPTALSANDTWDLHFTRNNCGMAGHSTVIGDDCCCFFHCRYPVRRSHQRY